MTYTPIKGATRQRASARPVVKRTIGEILERWAYDPLGLAVRVVPGADGRAKLQVRLDMGLLQLELDGRPDGQRPHGCASLLDWHIEQLEDYRRRYGTVDGYRLAASECEAIRREAAQYYQRYISLHQIGRFGEVARDTARNLRALDFLRRHAETADESWELEQHRPYITMMNALARAENHVSECDYPAAERVLATAMAGIRAFGAEHLGAVEVTRELDILGQRLRDVQRARPRSEAELLQRRLAAAIDREDYETAANLRDRLSQLAAPPPRGWDG
jgi:protein-arginine kinase activator protein McsA